VLHAFRDDIHLAGAEGDRAVSEVNPERAVQEKEGLVGVSVLVPDKVALEADHLN